MSWSPQHCAGARNPKDARDRFQCSGESGRFGWVLHGLWPEGDGATPPQWCSARPAPLSAQTVRRTLCMTPSPNLLAHEWAKHGTCMPGETPASFFRRSTGMYARLRYPDMNALSRRPLTAGQVATALARANPGLRADMMRITANREGWLDEVWLCLDRKFAFATCPAHQGGLAADARLRIWRGPR